MPGSNNILVTHMATAAFNRYEEFEGRSYLVAPVVPLIEGVVNGEFVPADEIGRYVDSWNGIPLPLDHPMDWGVPISANRPDLIQSRSVGRFFNASFDGNRLRGELWVDIEKCRSLGGDALEVLERLENGQPLEVSTAYFRDVEPVSGNLSGQQYNGVQRNLRPDHLALLPNGVGACSWADGAGAPRVNLKGGGAVGMSFKEWPKKALNLIQRSLGINAEDLTFGDKERIVRDALRGRTEWAFIADMTDEYVVYDDQGPDKPARHVRRAYSIDDNNNVTLGSDVEEVRKITKWEPANPPAPAGNTSNNDSPAGNSDNEAGQKGDDPQVGKKELIDGLIANEATKWAEGDRQFLDGLTEDQLSKLEPVQVQVQPPAVNTEQEETGQEGSQQEQEQEEEKQAQSFDEWVESIPDEEVREEMKANRKRIQERREQLIGELAANERCAFDKEELAGMKTNQLEKLSKSLQPEDYSGVGGPRANVQEDETEIPSPPPVILAKRDQEKETKEAS